MISSPIRILGTFIALVFIQLFAMEKDRHRRKNIRLDTIPSGEYVCIAFDWSAKNYDEYY